MKIAIASDAQSFFMKREMNRYLRPAAHQINNLGGLSQQETSLEQSQQEMREALQNGTADRGILLVTSDQDVTFNQAGIRAARCLDIAAAQEIVDEDVNLLIMETDKMDKQAMVETMLTFLAVSDVDMAANSSLKPAFVSEEDVDTNQPGENL
jgi:ribose 5-phosphate isomerase RpiB